nr:hypothetical protein [Tanacetum cinerariifolium]
MRTDPKEATYQFWFTISKIKDTSSYQFKLDKKKFRIGVEVFRDVLQICPIFPNQEFVKQPSHDEIVSFIKSLGYKGKSISRTKAEEHEAARHVHTTHECLVTNSSVVDAKPTHMDTRWRRQTGVVICDTPTVIKKKTPKRSLKLKGMETLSDVAMLEVDIRKTMKASVRVYIAPDVLDVYKAASMIQYLHEVWGSLEDDVILISEDERTESEKETTKSGKNDDDMSIDLDGTNNEEDEHVDDETQRDEYVHKEDEYVHKDD